MPLYHFKCPEHGVFEVVAHMYEAKSTSSCPECGSECKRAWKLDSAVVVWKGPGGSSIHYNTNIKEVEEEMFHSISETED